MKIGIMLRHLNKLGGIVVYTKNLIENLLEIDKKNEYIFLYNTNSLIGTYSKYKNVKEVVINIQNRLLWDQIGVPRVVRSEKIDIIFNPKLSIPLFAPSKKVFNIVGLEQFVLRKVYGWRNQLYNRIMMPIYCHFANAIIIMTNIGKVRLTKYINLKENKVEVIYAASNKMFKVIKNTESALKIKQKYNLPEKYILFVGGLTPLKNFSNILKALKIIKKEFPIKLVVVGFNRWKYDKDMELIEKLKLENDIMMLGFIPDDDLPYLYNSAELFIFPSLYEGFGMPVLEAQACGCPVVSSKTECIEEISKRSALLVNPYDHKEIAQAILDILNNEDLRDKLVAAGLENIKRFNWVETARQTLELFEKIYQS
ncbi:MAG: glycosyltransferase family 1 protein [Actinomycetota bacterium]|nr:glycosyltransferase family 1 protein [Actinomycetota bacterium]